MENSLEQEKHILAALDDEYQLAVQNNDAETMDRILADDFVLVLGIGTVVTKAELLAKAKSKELIYEYQEDTDKAVRIWGDTAVVTALLRAKGSQNGKPFAHKVWFSDTYVRTPNGWRYVLGQASTRLPNE